MATAMGIPTDTLRTMATMAVTWCGSASGTAMAGDHGPFRSAADNKPVRRATPQSSYGESGMRELRELRCQCTQLIWLAFAGTCRIARVVIGALSVQPDAGRNRPDRKAVREHY